MQMETDHLASISSYVNSSSLFGLNQMPVLSQIGIALLYKIWKMKQYDLLSFSIA